MTEPRYSDGKLAKWYYSRNRTISDGTDEYYLLNKAEVELEDGTIILGSNKLMDKLNELSEENKELKRDRNYWKTLAQSLAKNNGNVKLKDEHLAWKRVDLE